MPLAFLSELHGWYVLYAILLVASFVSNDARWHILTAIGGYTAVAMIDLITTTEVREDPTDLFAWPVPFAARHLMGA